MNETRIGIVLRIGVFSSALLTIFGIILVGISHHSLWISEKNARNFMTAGLLLLIYMQVVRVMLTGWLFAKRKEWLFFGCSVFIFLLLCYSVFWQA